MNEIGPAGCRENRQAIIDRLADQAKQLARKQIDEDGFVKGSIKVIGQFTAFGVLRIFEGRLPTIGELVDQAIEIAEKSAAECCGGVCS